MLELMMIASLLSDADRGSNDNARSAEGFDWRGSAIVRDQFPQTMPNSLVAQASGSGMGSPGSPGGSGSLGGGRRDTISPSRPGPGRTESPGNTGIPSPREESISPSSRGPGRTESPGSTGMPSAGTESVSPSQPGAGRTESPGSSGMSGR
jgi:hypothetical protein